MLVDRDAAAIVGDGEPVARLERHLDAVGVARHRLVHAVVEHLGGEMVQRPLVGAADIHAGPPPDRLQPLEHLDRMGVVIGAERAWDANRSDMVSYRGRPLDSRCQGASAEKPWRSPTPPVRASSTGKIDEICEGLCRWRCRSRAAIFSEQSLADAPGAPPLVGREAVRRFWAEAIALGPVELRDRGARGPGRGDVAAERGAYTAAARSGSGAPPGFEARLEDSGLSGIGGLAPRSRRRMARLLGRRGQRPAASAPMPWSIGIGPRAPDRRDATLAPGRPTRAFGRCRSPNPWSR